VIAGADVFLGLLGRRRAEAGDGDARWRAQPLILALANPDAGDPARGGARRRAPTAIIATGRSDYPNQVNNVLCFPYIFRGALDVRRDHDHRGDEARRGARDRRAGAGRAASDDGGRAPTAATTLSFGPEYLDPQAVRPAADPAIAPAVAQRGDGVGRGHAADRRLRRLPPSSCSSFVYRSGHADAAGLRSGQARDAGARASIAEGEDERVLRAAQVVRRRGAGAGPILVGRPAVIAARIERARACACSPGATSR
jgi:malate dehydrogenase (oxaloacetate-decarboxylating)(NADP+)